MRYSTDLSGLIAKRENFRKILQEDNPSDSLINLEQKEKNASEYLDKCNHLLTQLRKKYALKLEENLI